MNESARRSRATPEEALRTMESYRTLARDLASARALLPDNLATAALESAYTALHVAVSREPRFGRARLRILFRERIPAAARSVRGTVLWIALLLVASALAGWWLISTYPELIGLIASEKMIDAVEHGRLWTDQLFNIAPSSVLSLRIFSNNVVVSAGAFCAGFLFGLGTFYMIALNGLMLGGLFAFTHQHGLALALLKFILAHGPVELSVICLAGAAGAALGESLIRPTQPTRSESFRRRAESLGPLLLACALLLAGSGIIEGFISPDPRFSIGLRLVVGLGYWVFMLLFLSGKLWPAAPRLEGERDTRGVYSSAEDAMSARFHVPTLLAVATLAAAIGVTTIAAAPSDTASCFIRRNWTGGWRVSADARSVYISVPPWIYRLDLDAAYPLLRSPWAVLDNIGSNMSICTPLDFKLSVTDRNGGWESPIVRTVTRLTPAEAAQLPRQLRP